MVTQRPTYSELIDEIIKIYGKGDQRFEWAMADVYDGMAPRAASGFWDALEVRKPGGTLDEVISAWSKDELVALWRQHVWAPLRDPNRKRGPAS
jgi:hypothetical protein